MSYIRKGFTLFEIIIVLALIGLFVGAVSFYNDDARTNQISAERLTNTIGDTLRNARMNTVIGKGVMSGSTLVLAKERYITITLSGITTVYDTVGNQTNTGIENNIQFPFYDNDQYYKILDISVSSGTMVGKTMPLWDQSGVTAAYIKILPQGNVTISGSSVGTTIRTLRVTAGYKGAERSIVINGITGNSEIVTGRGENAYIPPPPATPVNGVCHPSDKFSCTSGSSSNQLSGGCGGVSIWNCKGANGGTTANCNVTNSACPIYSCTGPVPALNVTKSNDTGLIGDTPWQNSIPSNKCYYVCSGGFTGVNCEIAPAYTCTGPVPALNVTKSNESGLSVDTPWQNTDSANKCYYVCTGGFTGGNCDVPAINYCTLDAVLDCVLEF